MQHTILSRFLVHAPISECVPLLKYRHKEVKCAIYDIDAPALSIIYQKTVFSCRRMQCNYTVKTPHVKEPIHVIMCTHPLGETQTYSAQVLLLQYKHMSPIKPYKCHRYNFIGKCIYAARFK